MAEITFSSVFAVICDNIQARVKDKIFGEIFYSYFDEYDKSDVATDYTANKILGGRKAPTEKCKHFSGREKELRAFSEMLEAHDKVFLYGIGGIGKSEFVKKYISEHKKDYTNILYTTYSESIKNIITAIEYETKAIEFLHDTPQSHREVAICFNIYNSLGAFYIKKGDIPRAELCLMQAKAVCENFCIPIEEFPVLVANLMVLEEKKIMCFQQNNFK